MAYGKTTRYGLPYSNVVPSGTATNNITRGLTIDRFQLKLGGTALTKAMISRLKVKANGAVVIDATGTQIDKINAYRGANTTNPKFIDLFFKDESLNNEFDRAVGAFDTSAGIVDISTEVTLAGATAPVITPILFESRPQTSDPATARYAGLIAKLLNYPYNVSTGGVLPIALPFGPTRGSIIKRIHIFHGGNLTGVVMKQDSRVFHETVKDENEFAQVSAGRVPQANVYTIDFVMTGDIKTALDTRDAKSLELLCNFSAADVGEVLVEYIDPLANL